MSDKVNRRAKLLQQAALAERHLVLRSFKEAEVSSLELLHSANYVPGSSSELRRAAFVLVQALYEQGRYKEVLQVLKLQYGGLEKIDFDVMLLWVALAVDAKMTEEAAATLDKYIQMTNVSDGLQLSADQCAVSARMYAIELLARDAGSFHEAEAWLRSNALLTHDQRENIVEELLQMQLKSQVSHSVEPGTPKQPTERPLWNSSSDAQTVVAAAKSSHSMQPQEPPSAPSASGNASQMPQQFESRAPEQAEGSAGCSSVVQQGPADKAGSSRDAAASCGAHESPNQVPWYGDLSGSLSSWWSQGEGCAGLTQQQLAAVAAGGAVVLYAMMAERRALLGGIRRVAGGLMGGVSELARLALQLNPNPVAAAMAARQ